MHGRLATVIAAAGVAAIGVGVTACEPATSVPGPPEGCYESTQFADMYYSGVPNSRDNMDVWSSADGSCTDTVGGEVSDSTLVVAPHEGWARVICRSLGWSEAGQRWVELGYAGLPADAWSCSHTITK
jgi:hypothetical protein